MEMIKGDAVKIVDSEEVKKALLADGWKIKGAPKKAEPKKELNGKKRKGIFAKKDK